MPSVPFYSGGIRCASCLGWLCRPATLRFAQSVFAAYTPPQKTDLTSFAPLRRRELCETLGDILLTVRTSLAAPSGRGGRAQRGRRGKTLHTLSVTCGDSSPKGRSKLPLDKSKPPAKPEVLILCSIENQLLYLSARIAFRTAIIITPTSAKIAAHILA